MNRLAPAFSPATRCARLGAALGSLLGAALVLAACQPAARPGAPAPAAPPAAPAAGGAQSAAPASAAPAAPQPADVNFRFSWLDIGYNAAFYLAQERGYYREAQLNVTFQEGRGGDTALKLIANGSNDMGLSDAGVLLRGISQEMPVRAVAASMRSHPMAMIYRKGAPIARPADLVGKTVAMPSGSSQAFLFPAFLRGNGVDKDAVRVVTVDVAAAPATMLEGRADAYAAWWSTSPPIMSGQADYFVWADFGFNSLAEVMVANNSYLEKNPDAVRRFVAASQRAWTEARADPEAAVDAQIKLAPNNFSREVIASAMTGTLKHVDGPNTQGRPWGEMAEADWRATRDLLVEFSDLDPNLDVSRAWTNDYLPKR